MTTFAKVFNVPGGQRLVRKFVVDWDDDTNAAGIECVMYTNDAYFITMAFFDTKENRDAVFDAVTEDSFISLTLFELPGFFINGLVSTRCSLITE